MWGVGVASSPGSFPLSTRKSLGTRLGLEGVGYRGGGGGVGVGGSRGGGVGVGGGGVGVGVGVGV